MTGTPAWLTDALAADVELGVVEVDGVAIHYRAWGKPGNENGIVFVHGGAAHSRWWDHVAPFFAGDRRVVALDLSGHGDSGRREEYLMARWADEVLAAAAHGGAGPNPLVIGHSMGGMVAITAARLRGTELAGAVAVDTPFWEDQPEEQAAGAQQAFGPLRRYPSREAALKRFKLIPEQDGNDPAIHAHIAETSLRAIDGDWNWKFDPNVFRGRGRPVPLELPRCRVAVFRAEHGLVPPDMGERIAERLGRVVPVVEIPLAAHHVMIDQPLSLITALRTLLADWTHSEPHRPEA
ncbi:alpha/beta fold hydrolase [Cryptosporangium arvum]|uniref:Putative hydrolase or acyltransferase of alpha/beta superfamily n=1 Tax=Cryptosporangium arvum DSM 44712 TaxID=927661 RepID=A0A011AI71_9ACTN|nr:alpha/beta hydrolase [Cryptosporangium arvum]EXG81691.1 putative hydrolase or acyltransferase of alpha/beta superfamily [Cryptosporangium arvum DSM 44712]